MLRSATFLTQPETRDEVRETASAGHHDETHRDDARNFHPVRQSQ
jgi:hypothetical protein